MNVPPSALLLICSAAALLLGACVSTASVVQSRFGMEQNCPEDQVTVDQIGGDQYFAHGCDKETTYVCSAVAAFRGGVQCVQQGLSGPPSYREGERPALPPPDPKIPPPP